MAEEENSEEGVVEVKATVEAVTETAAVATVEEAWAEVEMEEMEDLKAAVAAEAEALLQVKRVETVVTLAETMEATTVAVAGTEAEMEMEEMVVAPVEVVTAVKVVH